MANITWAACTDVGPIRENNEDYLFAHKDLGIFLVADGVGGRAGGEVASQVAVETVHDQLVESHFTKPDHDIVTQAILKAHETVRQQAENNPDFQGMATTLCLVLLGEGVMGLAHVGDSRIYRWRKGKLEKLTQDHSAGNHVLTQAIGADSPPQPSWQCLKTAPGDIVFACTDGVTDVLTDADLEQLVTEHRGDTQQLADALVAQALARNTRDNTSVLVVKLEGCDQKKLALLSPRMMAGIGGVALVLALGVGGYWWTARSTPQPRPRAPRTEARTTPAPAISEPAPATAMVVEATSEGERTEALPVPPMSEQSPTVTAPPTATPTVGPTMTPTIIAPHTIGNLLERFRLAIQHIDEQQLSAAFVTIPETFRQQFRQWQTNLANPTCAIQFNSASVQVLPTGEVAFQFTYTISSPSLGDRDTKRTTIDAVAVEKDGVLLFTGQGF